MGSRDYIKFGSHNMYCEACKAKRKVEELRKRWDNVWVCNQCWELRHPMDSFRLKPERRAAFPTNKSHIAAAGQATTFHVFGEVNGPDAIGDILPEVGLFIPKGRPFAESE